MGVVKNIVSPLVTLLLIGGIGYGTVEGYKYIKKMVDPPKKTRAYAAIPVEVSKLTRRTVEERFDISATAAADESVDVKPKISGRLERLSLDDGTSTTAGTVVKCGEVIAMLDRPELEAKVAYAKAFLETSKGAADVAGIAAEVSKVNLVEAEREYQRQLNLQEVEAGTKQSLDKSITERDRCKVLARQTEAAFRQAKAAVEQAEASLKQAEINLNETVIRSPMDGVVTDKYIGLGSLVSPTTPLVTVANHYLIKIRMAVPQHYLKFIAPRQTMVKMSSVLWEDVITDSVYRIYPSLDQVMRTAFVEVRMNNFCLPDGNWAFRPGMYLNASILIDTHENVIAVPMDILVRVVDKYVVFVVEGAKVRAQDVKLGIRDGKWVEVTQGLKGDETIVVNGQFRLTDGAEISQRDAEGDRKL